MRDDQKLNVEPLSSLLASSRRQLAEGMQRLSYLLHALVPIRKSIRSLLPAVAEIRKVDWLALHLLHKFCDGVASVCGAVAEFNDLGPEDDFQTTLENGLEALEGGLYGTHQWRAEDVRHFVHMLEGLEDEFTLSVANFRESWVLNAIAF